MLSLSQLLVCRCHPLWMLCALGRWNGHSDDDDDDGDDAVVNANDDDDDED